MFSFCISTANPENLHSHDISVSILVPQLLNQMPFKGTLHFCRKRENKNLKIGNKANMSEGKILILQMFSYCLMHGKEDL